MSLDHVVVGNKEGVEEMWQGYTSLFAIFISSTEDEATQTDTHVANTLDGGRLELLNCGASATAMGTKALVASPYSTRLRPVSNLSKFAAYNGIYLLKAEFTPLDTTLTGSAPQDAQIDTEIIDSLLTDNDAYLQSRFRFGSIGDWQPNFFRPSLRVQGGDDVFETLNNSNFGTSKNNLGDLSIGCMLPYTWKPAIPLYLGKVTDLNEAIIVHAGAGQIVEDTVLAVKKVQRYPVHCYMEFLGKK